MLLIVNKG